MRITIEAYESSLDLLRRYIKDADFFMLSRVTEVVCPQSVPFTKQFNESVSVARQVLSNQEPVFRKS